MLSHALPLLVQQHKEPSEEGCHGTALPLRVAYRRVVARSGTNGEWNREHQGARVQAPLQEVDVVLEILQGLNWGLNNEIGER